MSKNSTNGSSIVKQLKEVPGLFSCFLEHQVTKTTAQFKWTGPVIPEEEWWQMLQFFQWSYDTTKSETQVRLYVHKVTGTWKIWAFPQEAKGGMSATELDTPAAAEQRTQFNPTDGWLYFGTVHHHCGMQAFQSSVDEANEKSQDGIHITIGNMDANRYTMHERFYLCGSKIEHDMSWFWHIGAVMDSVPGWASKFLPGDIKDRIARGQMCEKPPEGTTFPQQWKDNLIYKAPVVSVYTGGVYSGGLGYQGSKFSFQRVATNLNFDLAKGREQLMEMCCEMKIEEQDLIGEMQNILNNDQTLVSLIALLYRNDLSLDKFCDYCEEEFIKETRAAEKVRETRKDDRKTTGIPDYEGGTHTDFGSGKLPM